MGEFIRVKVDMHKCLGIKNCGGCVRVCPVNIFGSGGEAPVIVKDNEGECILFSNPLGARGPNLILTVVRHSHRGLLH
jgi:ferredoxin